MDFDPVRLQINFLSLSNHPHPAGKNSFWCILQVYMCNRCGNSWMWPFTHHTLHYFKSIFKLVFFLCSLHSILSSQSSSSSHILILLETTVSVTDFQWNALYGNLIIDHQKFVHEESIFRVSALHCVLMLLLLEEHWKHSARPLHRLTDWPNLQWIRLSSDNIEYMFPVQISSFDDPSALQLLVRVSVQSTPNSCFVHL